MSFPVTTRAGHELILGIDTAVELVTSFNQRTGRVAECRLFTGLSDEETGNAPALAATAPEGGGLT